MSITRHETKYRCWETKYRCWDDCTPGGCPGHEATLEIQTVSDTLTFEDGKGSQISMHPPELEAFLCMLNSLATSNSAVSDALKTAFGIVAQ